MLYFSTNTEQDTNTRWDLLVVSALSGSLPCLMIVHFNKNHRYIEWPRLNATFENDPIGKFWNKIYFLNFKRNKIFSYIILYITIKNNISALLSQKKKIKKIFNWDTNSMKWYNMHVMLHFPFNRHFTAQKYAHYNCTYSVHILLIWSCLSVFL